MKPRLDMLFYREWAESACYQAESDLKDEYVGRNHRDLESIWRDDQILGIPAVLTFAVGWSEMIPETFYTSRDVFVVHPSPLPLYRGGSPIQHQIINGEETMAVSIFKLDANYPAVDSGPIAWQSARFPIGPKLSLADILEEIAFHSAYGIAHVARLHAAGSLQLLEQDGTWATHYSRRKPEESEIVTREDKYGVSGDFQQHSARALHDKVRALQDPYPNVYIVCADGKKLYITETHLEEEHRQ